VLSKDLKKTSFSIENNILTLTGSISLAVISELLHGIERQLMDYRGGSLIINLDDLEDIDSGGITAIYHLRDKVARKGISVQLEGGKSSVKHKLELFHPEKPGKVSATRKGGFFERIGSNTSHFIKNYILGFFQLAADITFWSVTDLFYKQTSRKGEVINQAVLIGVNAILIVATMSFIIGLVLALQSAAQLRSFGANIYIVDLTVIAMMSEMGPLITAIMVAGRSGSAIAAEMATMKVTSETDALRTMGLNPIRFAIVPKMHGGLMTMPFLTIIADIAGIAGGFIIAITVLDISPLVFIHRIEQSLFMRDIVFGVVKSFVFIYIIIITGSFFGFRVKRGAAEVGRVTTIAVVVAISLVILADAVLGLLFY
jgi:phospholipid/cholesterol/gamma-HCH transport system permease protein